MKLPGYAFLESLLMFGVRPGLDTTQTLCDALNSPQKSFETIHVVGTNGKGSTSYYLSLILSAHGKKTALYTSPHLVSLRERLRIGNIPVSEMELNEALLEVQQAAIQTKITPTYFEALTVAAFLICRNKKIDVLVAEAGLGGKFDATTIAQGKMTVLTSIGLEHTAVLGYTLEAILGEKLGIMKKKSKLVHFPIPEHLWQEFEKQKKIIEFQEVPNYSFPCPSLKNKGIHYKENAKLALSAAQNFLEESFKKEIAENALKNVFWPGRMQLLYDKQGNLKFILDGAHNSHAITRLAETLNTEFPNQKFPTLLGVLQDKDLKEMLNILQNHVLKYYPVRTPYERFRNTETMTQEILNLGFMAENAGMISRELLYQIANENKTPILITGSLYLIGACIEFLKEDFDDLAFFRGMKLENNEKH
jgi:dihydrofolate synthase/folylpolyglutamate synthase